MGLLPVAADIMLTNAVVSNKRKSGNTWAHRTWLAQRTEASSVWPAFSSSELSACQRFVALYPRNYFAWTYRTHLIRRCTVSQVRSVLAVAVVGSHPWLSSVARS
jgi:hypothetical protein